MSDPVGAALHAVASGTPAALPLAFVAGAATSIGPCVAPRYVAVAALAARARSPWPTAALFACGVTAAYVTIGAAAGALRTLRGWSSAIDLLLAAGLVAGGAITLLRRDDRCCGDTPPLAGTSAGATLLLGAASALVVSPCCTPVIAAIAGVTTLSGRAGDGALLTAAFAAGHVLPIVAVTAGGRGLTRRLSPLAGAPAAAVIGGTLMLALGAYYGALA